TGFGRQDLRRVLVCADRSVRSKSKEQGAHRARRFYIEVAIDVQAGIRHVVGDADGETMLGLALLQFVEYGLRHRRIEILGGEAVAAADDLWPRRNLAGRGRSRISREHVPIERLPPRPPLPWSIQDRPPPDP